MFKTGVSEYADVLLPLPDFLEGEGHILSMDNRLKKVNRAVTPPGNVRSIARIVSGLAKVMGEPGFSRKTAEIYRELKTFVETPGQPVRDATPLDLNPLFKEISQIKPVKSDGYPMNMMMMHNHFRYRGNRLSGLVSDLGSISHEGTVGLPDSLMEKLKVKEGDHVRILSENGALDAVARAVPGLNDQTACLNLNGIDLRELQDGIYAENQVVHVKIEKV